MKRSVKTNEMIVIDDTFNVTDYPSCELFFPFNDAATGLVPTDLVTGLTYTVALGGFTFDGNSGTALGPATSLTGSKGGPNLGSTKDFIAILASDLGSNTDEFTIRTDTGINAFRFKRDDATGACLISDEDNADTLFSGQTAVDVNTEMVAMYSDRSNALGGGADHYLAESDGVTVANAESILIAGGADGNIDLSANNLNMNVNTGVVCYGMAIFSFAKLPTDVLAAISWMSYHWRNGNKVIYPPWKNKT